MAEQDELQLFRQVSVLCAKRVPKPDVLVSLSARLYLFANGFMRVTASSSSILPEAISRGSVPSIGNPMKGRSA